MYSNPPPQQDSAARQVEPSRQSGRPSYYFSIMPMRQRGGSRERHLRSGDDRWIPPRSFGNNLGYPLLHFLHSGSETSIVDDVPVSARLYKTYSMYYDRTVIWTVPYDATAEQAYNGQDASASDEEPEPAVTSEQGQPLTSRDDWASLSFRHYPNYLSYAGRRLENARLRIQRPDQPWASQLLPDAYIPLEETQQVGAGGMVGELPLLIGLMALALPEAHVPIALPGLMLDSWRVMPNWVLSRGSGCKYCSS